MARHRPRLFWDSSALVGALMSRRAESPGRVLMRLGEAGLADMRVSQDVLQDVEWVLRKRGRGDLVSEVAVALDRAGFVAVPEPNEDTVAAGADLTGYWADARVLAAAEECGADVFVTTDKEHFIGNPLIGPPATNCRVMTPDEVLEWCRARVVQDDGPGP